MAAISGSSRSRRSVASRKAKSAFPILSFDSEKAWKKWLALNHARAEGIWLRFYKKTSGKKSVAHSESLDWALCYGWIDGQLKPCDAESWLHKFTPRRPQSTWSRRNTERAEVLMAAGKMRRAGMKQVLAAKAAGRWQRAYDSPRQMSVPRDFMQAVSNDKRAKEFFESLDKANTYAIAWRLQTAVKPETRKKRFEEMLAMLAKGRALHPKRA